MVTAIDEVLMHHRASFTATAQPVAGPLPGVNRQFLRGKLHQDAVMTMIDSYYAQDLQLPLDSRCLRYRPATRMRIAKAIAQRKVTRRKPSQNQSVMATDCTTFQKVEHADELKERMGDALLKQLHAARKERAAATTGRRVAKKATPPNQFSLYCTNESCTARVEHKPFPTVVTTELWPGAALTAHVPSRCIACSSPREVLIP